MGTLTYNLREKLVYIYAHPTKLKSELTPFSLITNHRNIPLTAHLPSVWANDNCGIDRPHLYLKIIFHNHKHESKSLVFHSLLFQIPFAVWSKQHGKNHSIPFIIRTLSFTTSMIYLHTNARWAVDDHMSFSKKKRPMLSKRRHAGEFSNFIKLW